MAMLNIPSSNTDPNYRYRMPRLVSKVEGRGNGIKTNIMNMADIARSLKRPPEYTTKFCGCELGTQSKFDLAEGKAIVNGAHTNRDLQVLIDKFIEKFVLCPKCTLPEIDIVLDKSVLACRCNACGHSGDLDNSHKVASFIIRNPPKGGDSTMGKQTEGRGKASRGGKKRRDDDGDPDGLDSGDEMPGLMCGGSRDKKKSKDKKKKKKHEGSDGNEDAEQGGVKKSKSKKKDAFGADTVLSKDGLTYDSPEIAGVKERMLAFIAQTKAETVAAAAESVTSASAEQMPNSEVVRDDAISVLGISPEAFFAELRVLQVSQDFDSCLRLFVALEVLLTPTSPAAAVVGEEPVAEQSVEVTGEKLDEIMPYINKLIDASMSTSKLCRVIEDFVVLRTPASMKHFGFLLHKLFLAGHLAEDALITRYTIPDEAESSAKTKKKKQSKTPSIPVDSNALQAVQPFILWLQAESDDSDEEEEAESDNGPMGLSAPRESSSSSASNPSVPDANGSSPPGVSNTTASSTVAAADVTKNVDAAEDEDDDDLDIDDI